MGTSKRKIVTFIVKIIAFCCFSVVSLVVNNVTQAEMVDFQQGINLKKVNPYGNQMETSVFNGLVIDQLPPVNPFPRTQSGTFASREEFEVIGRAGYAPSYSSFLTAQQYKSRTYTQWSNASTKIYEPYKTIHMSYKGTNSTSIQKVAYQDIGSYRETPDSEPRRINMSIWFRNLSFSNKWLQGVSGRTTESLISISQNPWLGYVYYQFDNLDLVYEFYYKDTGEIINFDSGNAFLAFNSLNGDMGTGGTTMEYVAYRDATTKTLAYVTNDSNVVIKFKTGSGTAYSGKLAAGNSEAGFTDDFNHSTFFKNSISFQLNGTQNRFTVGSTPNAMAWNATASNALFRNNPGTPKKAVLNAAKVDINGQSVKRGDTIYYDIKQRTNTYKVDLLSPWNSFIIEDNLPTTLTYHSAELLDSDGNVVAKNSPITYDPNTRKVKFTASSEFLKVKEAGTSQDRNKYDGSTYTLRIRAVVNDDAEAGSVFTNKATTTIENLVQETNTVLNSIPIGNLSIVKTDEMNKRVEGVVFSVKDANGNEYLTPTTNKTDANGEIKLEGIYTQEYTIKEVLVPDGYELNAQEQKVTVKPSVNGSYTLFNMKNLFKRYKLHIRQVVLNEQEELVLPKGGFYQLKNQDKVGNESNKEYSFTSGSSTIDDHSIVKELYTTLIFNLDMDKLVVNIRDVVPEYYNYSGYIQTKNDSNLANEHVSISPNFIENHPLLDYDKSDEYWVTVFIQPKFGTDNVGNMEKSPRPYSWNTIKNDFGTILKKQ